MHQRSMTANRKGDAGGNQPSAADLPQYNWWRGLADNLALLLDVIHGSFSSGLGAWPRPTLYSSPRTL